LPKTSAKSTAQLSKLTLTLQTHFTDQVSLLAGGLWVFLSRKNSGKHGARDRWRHLIFARVQDGAGDRELRVFRGFPDKNTHKPPENRLR